MANARIGNKGTPNNTLNYEEITVDTDPGASGYACEGVCLANLAGKDKMSFYISAITGATVNLQWSRDNVTFTTYGDDYTTVTKVNIYDETVYWRSIVADDNQGTTSTSGIDW